MGSWRERYSEFYDFDCGFNSCYIANVANKHTYIDHYFNNKILALELAMDN